MPIIDSPCLKLTTVVHRVLPQLTRFQSNKNVSLYTPHTPLDKVGQQLNAISGFRVREGQAFRQGVETVQVLLNLISARLVVGVRYLEKSPAGQIACHRVALSGSRAMFKTLLRFRASFGDDQD